ncbi:MAG: hypothetical protein WDN76_10640 [Alphaproteobacteria bacterium]
MFFGGALAASGLPIVFAPGALAQIQDDRIIEFKESKYNTIYIMREGAMIGMIFGVNRPTLHREPVQSRGPQGIAGRLHALHDCGPSLSHDVTSVLEIGLGGGRTASYLSKHMGRFPRHHLRRA